MTGWLRQDNRCAFELASDQPPYCGLRGQARAVIEPEKWRTHSPSAAPALPGRSVDHPLARNLLRRSNHEVAIRLDPINHFTWNYRERMKDSLNSKIGKPCPD